MLQSPEGQRKEPRAATSIPDAKKPQSLGIDHDNAWHRQPVWRFGDIDMDCPQGASLLTADDFSQLHTALGSYETQTCNEIWGQHDNGCKRYTVDEAHDNIQSRLIELERDDETAVHTLRVTGAYRVYGVLRDHVFYVLWIDRDHEMWPSQKKHT